MSDVCYVGQKGENNLQISKHVTVNFSTANGNFVIAKLSKWYIYLQMSKYAA